MAHFPVSKWSLCSRFFFLANIMAKPDLPTTRGSRASTPRPPLAGKAAWEESRPQGRPEVLERAVKTLKEQVTTVARGGWRALERNNSAAEGLSSIKGGHACSESPPGRSCHPRALFAANDRCIDRSLLAKGPACAGGPYLPPSLNPTSLRGGWDTVRQQRPRDLSEPAQDHTATAGASKGAQGRPHRN